MTPQFEYTSPLFSQLPEYKSHVSIVLSKQRGEIAISSPEGVLVYLRSFNKPNPYSEQEFFYTLNNEFKDVLKMPFSQKKLLYNIKEFTLIPNSLDIDGEEAFSILRSSTNEETTELKDQIPSLDTEIYYTVPNSTYKFAQNNLPDFEHQSTIKSAILISEQLRNYDAFLCLNDFTFELVCYRNSHLSSVVHDRFTTPEDVVYFLLLGLRDAEIPVKEAQIAVSGRCDSKNQIVQELASFVRKVDVKLFDRIEIGSDFEHQKQYYQYVLNLLHANH